jgi:hypothetical protein
MQSLLFDVTKKSIINSTTTDELDYLSDIISEARIKEVLNDEQLGSLQKILTDQRILLCQINQSSLIK